MPWGTLVDHFLAENRRKREIEVESDARYGEWLEQAESMIQVFVKRVNDLNFDDSADLSRFYELIENLSSRAEDLRESTDASKAPANSLVKLEELVELLNETTQPPASGVVTINETPFERAKRKEREREKEQERIGWAIQDREKIANKIQIFLDSF